MSSAKVTSLLEGVPQLLRKLQLADAATRERTKAAIQHGTKAVADAARSRAPKVTGEMASTIRDEYSADGLIGYVKVGLGKLPRRSRASTAARKQRLASKRKRSGTRVGKGAYAPVVERGDPRRHHKPHPFLLPAFSGERTNIVNGLQQATAKAAKDSGLA